MMLLRPHRLRDESGSILPLILVFVLIVLLMLMGMMAATGAFIGQRDLQSVCDETATAVASEVNLTQPRTLAPDGSELLALDEQAVAAAVESFRVKYFSHDPGLQMVGTVEGGVATVECRTTVQVPFGGVFGKGDGVERNAVSAIRSPTTKPTSEARILTDEEAEEARENNLE